MTATPVILGISGSLRAGSHNTSLLRYAARLASPASIVTMWDELAEVPPFNEDHEYDPAPEVLDLRAEIESADGLLIATPEYNTSVPGQLKNALDWASRPYGEGVLIDKPVAVVSASISDYGAEWSHNALRHVLSASGSRVVQRQLCVPRADTAFDGDEELKDPQQRSTLTALLEDLAELAHPVASKAA